MNSLETRYGTLVGISNYNTHPDGSLFTCVLEEENKLQTPVGEIVPQYRMAELGERQKKHRSSLIFFENGQIKSAALDRAMPLKTPLGVFKAELVTFYEDGSVNRLFPLNGQVDAYWSEKNEGELAEVLDFDLPVGKFSAKIIGLHFYPSGALKSLTLWPGQHISLNTPAGPMRIRTGFSLYENGALRSVEPSGAIELVTPIGRVKAFDAEMLGMHADQNSIQFSPKGRINSLKTIHTGIRALSSDQYATVVEPFETSSLIHDSGLRTVPMQIDFSDDTVAIIAKDTHRFDFATHSFQTFDRVKVIHDSCGGCGDGDGRAHCDDCDCSDDDTKAPCATCDGGPTCCKNK